MEDINIPPKFTTNLFTGSPFLQLRETLHNFFRFLIFNRQHSNRPLNILNNNNPRQWLDGGLFRPSLLSVWWARLLCGLFLTNEVLVHWVVVVFIRCGVSIRKHIQEETTVLAYLQNINWKAGCVERQCGSLWHWHPSLRGKTTQELSGEDLIQPIVRSVVV